MLPNPTNRRRQSETASAVTIRRVATLAEYQECVLIERETWGSQFTEAVPSTILRIAQEVGGVTAAAFDTDGAMLGFVFGITGVRNGQLSHWSDMLAVRVGARDMGLGKRLKAYQRELLLEIGVRTMYWTYDPLVARNAYLNLEQLGARAVEYRTNFYGEDTGSVMHAALGTDRFIVSWQLDQATSPRPPDPTWATVPVVNAEFGTLRTESHRVRIVIPDDIFAVLEQDPALARRWHEATRGAFDMYLERGYSVVGFSRGSEPNTSAYLLKQQHE